MAKYAHKNVFSNSNLNYIQKDSKSTIENLNTLHSEIQTMNYFQRLRMSGIFALTDNEMQIQLSEVAHHVFAENDVFKNTKLQISSPPYSLVTCIFHSLKMPVCTRDVNINCIT